MTFFVQSLAVDTPFTTARDNLIIAFEKQAANHQDSELSLCMQKTKRNVFIMIALGYGQDVLHLHVGTRVLRSDRLSCPDQLSSKDQVEAARTAVINQEIKHILKDVLLTKMKISSMARPPQDESIPTNKRAKAAEIFSDLEVVYRYRLELYMQCFRLEMYADRHFIFPLPSLHRICVVLKMPSTREQQPQNHVVINHAPPNHTVDVIERCASFHTVEEYDDLLQRINSKTNDDSELLKVPVPVPDSADTACKKDSSDDETGNKTTNMEFQTVASLRQWLDSSGSKGGGVYAANDYPNPRTGFTFYQDNTSNKNTATSLQEQDSAFVETDKQHEEESIEELVAAFDKYMQQLQIDEDNILRQISNTECASGYMDMLCYGSKWFWGQAGLGLGENFDYLKSETIRYSGVSLSNKKLTGPNFIDWYIQLRLGTFTEDKEYTLSILFLLHHCTTWRANPPSRGDLQAHGAWVKGRREVCCTQLNSSDCEEFHTLQAGGVNRKGSKKPKEKLAQSCRGGKGKGKNKMGYAHNNVPFAPKPKTSPPPKKDNPSKDAICHQCGEVGHWRRNCHRDLDRVMKKKKLPQGLRGSRKLKPGALKSVRGDGHRCSDEAIWNLSFRAPSRYLLS
ncbi:zinc finger, CCHC-type containing protein [Tanacetum coccineum]